MGKNKRKRCDDAYKNAYQGVTITARESSGRPGTPHAFFKQSFEVVVDKPSLASEKKEEGCCNGRIVVHQHANGLCIVTVGDDDVLPDRGETVKDISFQVQEAPQQSANERRKRQSKMLKGKTAADVQQGITSPNTILARINIGENGDTLNVPAGVWGTVLELNPNLTAQLLRDDPLLDGYVAIIFPTGPFPPTFRHKDEDDEEEEQPADKKVHVDATTADD